MIRHIRLEFVESERERTQEFTLAWSGQLTGPSSEIVRQQWNFNPQGSTSEIEDYQVNLPNVAILELRIRPELNAGAAYGKPVAMAYRVAGSCSAPLRRDACRLACFL